MTLQPNLPPRTSTMGILAAILPVGLPLLAATVEPTRPPVLLNQAADAIVNYLKPATLFGAEAPAELRAKGWWFQIETPLGAETTRDMAIAALRQLVDQYEGTRVTHLLWNVNYQRAAYRSRVWASYWDVPEPEQNLPPAAGWRRKYYELHKLGIDDVFGILLPRCRERGISPWLSVRMNDHHYRTTPFAVSPFMVDHPELRLDNGKGLFNYAKPEVRQHYLVLIAEILERYDPDGIELDWMRSAPIFAADEPEGGRPIATAFLQQVRALTVSAGQRLGHPVRLAARVPATPELASALGLDAVGWVRQGLLDILIPGHTGYPDVPVGRWRQELGAAGKNCLIMPGTDRAYGGVPDGPTRGLNRQTTRGFTASMLDRGADGLYLFNHFMAVDFPLRYQTPAGGKAQDTMRELLTDVGDLGAALAGTRLHVLTPLYESTHRAAPPQSGASLPLVLAAAAPATLRLHLGPAPATGRCLIRVGFGAADGLGSARLRVHINGTSCRALEELPPPVVRPAAGKPEDAPHAVVRLAQFEAPLPAIVRGYNEIMLAVTEGAPQRVVWLEAAIEPPGAHP